MITDQIHENITKLFKFSWSQAFSDQNGKSSVIPLTGTITIFVGNIGFLIGAVTKDVTVITNSVMLVTIGSAMLLGRKIVNGKPDDLPFVSSDDKTNETT